MKRLHWLLRNTAKGGSILLLSLLIIGPDGSPAAADVPPPPDLMKEEVTQGALRLKIGDEVVECPLKRTDVKVDITGFIARATVTQTFYNPYDKNIEAVYVFPLPHTAAIDAMTMKMGERTIVGVIKRRAEARAIYEQAIQRGQTASLLEQERPNIFTQSVGNLKPRQEIHIEISYVDVLNYDVGTYEFHFPMVVGPRYIPGAPISEKPQLPKELEGKVGEGKEGVTKVTRGPDPSGTGWSPDTDRVPDASRITPPVLKPGYRTGHDIRLAVSLDAGVPVQDIEIVNHAAKLERLDAAKATVNLSPLDAIPNKDFVLKYKVVGEKPEMAVFAHATGPEQRYFMLMLQPKRDAVLGKAPPRELVFLVDSSGSMSGELIAKVKAAMRHFLQQSTPKDTLQVITFANQANSLFEKSVPITEANLARALAFTQQLHGGGGTEMLAGIKAVLNAPVDPKRVRIVVLLTDGYIGNEEQIIAEVGRRAGDSIRFWTIGIGASPNRFLIDGVAQQGGGMSAVLDLNTNPKPLVTRIVNRIHSPQLTNIQVDWQQLAVYETYPRRIPELWAHRPVILFGRYAAGGSAKIALSGIAEGKPFTYTVDVTLPDADPTHAVLGKVWARRKIEDLSAQMYDADTPEVVEEITRIALDYGLMSQWTSFVAVDESEMPTLSQQAIPPRRVVVPVPLPEGVSFEGVFGQEEKPQFFYDLFGRELLAPQHGRRNGLNEDSFRGILNEDSFRRRYTEFAIGDSNRFKPNYRHQKEFDASGELMAGWTGQLNRLDFTPPVEQVRASGGRGLAFQEQGSPHSWQYVPNLSGHLWSKLSEAEKTAMTEAETLQQGGALEAARLRYQHALGLMAGVHPDAVAAIQALDHEILKKRAEAYPRLNRKLNGVLRNQPLADAVCTLATAGGFHLDWVPGSLDDVSTLLNLSECRVTYLDLRQATILQGLQWLLTPYHLTWRMKDAETLTVGTARRMPGTSAWGYNVQDITLILTSQLDENASTEDIDNVLGVFLQTLRTVIDPKEDSGITPGSVVLITPGRLLVYGTPDVHEQVNQFLEALKDSTRDIASIAAHALSKDAREDLKALQQLTTGKWQTFAEARKKAAAAKTRQHVIANLETASWQLLAAAIHDEIDLEALTKLQMAWASRQLEPVVEVNRLLAMWSAWCIRTAAQAVPADVELAALSQDVLSKIRQMTVRKPENDTYTAYLGTLYAVLARQTGDAPDKGVEAAIKALIKEPANAELGTLALIAEGLLAPSEENDKALQVAISTHQIYRDDLVLLTCLIAKRRGGQLWRTFQEELPHIAKQGSLSGYILVILHRLEASRSPI